MAETLFEGFRQWLHDLTAPADDAPDVDVEYIRAGMEYKYLTTEPEQVSGDKVVRCDLCGKLFDVRRFPDTFDHLDDHDSQGGADVDPFELEEVVASMDYSDIESVGEDRVKMPDVGAADN